MWSKIGLILLYWFSFTQTSWAHESGISTPTLVIPPSDDSPLQVDVSEGSTIYYLAVPRGETPPTVEEVLAGTLAKGFPLAAGSFQSGGARGGVRLYGLNGSSDFDFYLVAIEASNALQTDVTFADQSVAGVIVSRLIGKNTTETDNRATTVLLMIRLTTRPTAPVTLSLRTSNEQEAELSPDTMTFTPENWNGFQWVYVSGTQDDEADGDILYQVILDPLQSDDLLYNGLDPEDISLVNRDDDTAGILVSAVSGPVTEDGLLATFSLSLRSKPLANVEIPLRSQDLSEALVTPSSVVFTPQNWNASQTVTVHGVDDFHMDGNVSSKVVLRPAASDDPHYSGLDADDVTVTTLDDETAGFLIESPDRFTHENGKTAVLTIRLTALPKALVRIPVKSSNLREGSLSVEQMVFDSGNWNVPQTLVVKGVDDGIIDGHQSYSIIWEDSLSLDPRYEGKRPPQVMMINEDNDSAGFILSAITGSVSEPGSSFELTIRLTAKPTGDVAFMLGSSNPKEGIASPSQLLFSPENWSIPQRITIQGVDDAIIDGNQPFSVVLGAVVSTDPLYLELDPPDIAMVNEDNDLADIFIITNRLDLTEDKNDYPQTTFTVQLKSQPAATVLVDLSSSDETEGLVFPQQLQFSSQNWSQPQVVTVKAQDDQKQDGTVAITIDLDFSESEDFAYRALVPHFVKFTKNVNPE